MRWFDGISDSMDLNLSKLCMIIVFIMEFNEKAQAQSNLSQTKQIKVSPGNIFYCIIILF